MTKEVQLEYLDRLPWLETSNKERNQRGRIWKMKNLIWVLISILGVSLSSKIQLTQGRMGWNRDSNIYNFTVLSFSKFLIFECRN